MKNESALEIAMVDVALMSEERAKVVDALVLDGAEIAREVAVVSVGEFKKWKANPENISGFCSILLHISLPSKCVAPQEKCEFITKMKVSLTERNEDRQVRCCTNNQARESEHRYHALYPGDFESSFYMNAGLRLNRTIVILYLVALN